MASAPTDRPGFKALLDIVRSGNADAVVIANLQSLSPDKITQEIMISDIRRSGASLIATDENDLSLLRDGADDHTRIVVRDIVDRVSEYRDAFGLSGSEAPSVEASVPYATDGEPDDSDGGTNVVVELIAPTG